MAFLTSTPMAWSAGLVYVQLVVFDICRVEERDTDRGCRSRTVGASSDADERRLAKSGLMPVIVFLG